MPAVQDRHDRINAVACRLFREKGFHATSVREIADAIGILGGSLYAHIESKDDVLWQIVNSAGDRFFAAVGPIAESPLGSLQKLRAAIIAHVGVIADDLDAAAVHTVEWKHLSPERRAAFTKRRDEYEGMFRVLVREAIHQGFIAASDEAMATRFILSTLNYLFAWYRVDGPLPPEEVGRLLADFVLDGLRRRTA